MVMSTGKKTVLICDDSLLVRKKLRELIEKSLDECEIVEATDGQSAVQLYKDNNPDLVFMDIVMPAKDGITAVDEIKQHDRKSKIVMLSSVGTQQHLRKAIEAGAFEFVQKPWKDDQIEFIIKRALG
ncbi:MAG: response regulator [Peptococcaceae bacterium]|nr:response regulator [Peptococcaceae bacterium]